MTKQTAGNPTGPSPFGPTANPFAGNPFAANPFAGNPFAGSPFAGAFTPQTDALGKGREHAVQAWMQFNRAVLEGVGKLQQETSRFVIRRLEEDLDRQRQLLACRSPEDAWQVCADAARQTVEDYTEEAGRLSEIAAEVQYACSGFGEMLAGSAIETGAVETGAPESAESRPQGKPGRKPAA